MGKKKKYARKQINFKKMLIKVKVFPESGEKRVFKKADDEFEVHVKERAQDNEANKAVCRLLSRYFDLGRGSVRIIKGGKKRNKIIKINGAERSSG